MQASSSCSFSSQWPNKLRAVLRVRHRRRYRLASPEAPVVLQVETHDPEPHTAALREQLTMCSAATVQPHTGGSYSTGPDIADPGTWLNPRRSR